MISLIAVVARNRTIGRNNALLWHLPEDLRHFRDVTRGKPVIMGRKTWESLPAAFRPLPGRRIVVVSRIADYVAIGAQCVTTLDAAVRLCAAADEAFVIGGEQIYRQALPFADRLYLTEVDEDADGDAFFPAYEAREWQEVSRQAKDTSDGPAYSFAVYQRRGPVA